MTHDINIHHEDDHESASSYLVGEIRNLLVNSKRNFSIGLSGGNTPKLTYSMMAEKFNDLSKTFLWTIDDRWIEDNNDLSNQRMINEYFERTNANILKFEFPVIIINGSEDSKYIKIGERIDSFLADSNHFIVSKCGHNVHLEQFDKFISILGG